MKKRGVPAGKIYVKKSSSLQKHWWMKFMRVEKEKPTPIGAFPAVRSLDLFSLWDIGEPTADTPTCQHFSCGRTLSLREQLFGNTCIKHSPDLTGSPTLA